MLSGDFLKGPFHEHVGREWIRRDDGAFRNCSCNTCHIKQRAEPGNEALLFATQIPAAEVRRYCFRSSWTPLHVSMAVSKSRVLASKSHGQRHEFAARQGRRAGDLRSCVAQPPRSSRWHQDVFSTYAKLLPTDVFRTKVRRVNFIFVLVSGCITTVITWHFRATQKYNRFGGKSSFVQAVHSPPPLDYLECQTSLHPPPRLDTLLPRLHRDGRARDVPNDHLQPFVYNAVALPARDFETNASQILLFLYSQGTVACPGDERGCFNLNVTSCLVGIERFPVIFEANGVYTCLVTRELRLGELLTVIVTPSTWKQQPLREHVAFVMRHLATLAHLHDGSYVIQSDVTWEGQMDPPVQPNEGRYRVCIMTQEKVFPNYLPEWLTYHRKIGVDYVYIYDNRAATNLSEMYKNSQDVEVVQWPWERSQIQAQNHFLLTGRRRCQWGVLIDVDEYVMMRAGEFDDGLEQPLKALLRHVREVKDFSQIRLTSVALGSSGNVYRPRRAIAESYWHLANIQDNLTKPIVWLGHTLPNSLVHHVNVSGGYYSETTPGFHSENTSRANIGLIHMKYRSWNDYVEKAHGGRNSFQVSSWSSFSSNWTVHRPTYNHLVLRNVEAFTEFRGIWRRVMGRTHLQPMLGAWDEAKERYGRIRAKGWAWKRRRGLENSTFSNAVVEKEKMFREMKDWEIRKQKRFAQWNKTVEF